MTGLRTRHLLIALLSALLGGGLVWIFARPAPPSAPRSVRLAISLPPDQRLSAFAIDGDGSRLVYAAEPDGRPRLYVRLLARFEIVRIPGTEGAHCPFFSPDGQWIAFFADGMLRKVRADGNAAPVNICDAPADSAGGSWGDDSRIVFAPLHGKGLVRVSADGGTPEPLTRPDSSKGEMAHGWPHVLPHGAGVLFTVSRRGRDSRIAVLPSGSQAWQLLLPATGQAHYISTGHLVYGFSGELLAAPFDLEQLRVRGAPSSVVKEIPSALGFGELGRTAFSAARDGTLVWAPAVPEEASSALVWVDREGRATPLSKTPGDYLTPRLSPDGKRLAVAMRSGVMTRDIWICDLERDTRERLTAHGGDNHSPVWMPDGRRLTFASNMTGPQSIYVTSTDGRGEPRPLVAGGAVNNPSSWSRDGRLFAFYEVNPGTGRDIWLLRSGGQPNPVLATAFNERSPALSPDGRWLAYVSDESGGDEVYVRPTGASGPSRRISTGGGTEPVWSRNGRDLFYRQADLMMAVPVAAEPAFNPGNPQRLFEREYERDPGGNLPDYDVSPDGRRFVMVQSAHPSELRLVLNWRGEGR